MFTIFFAVTMPSEGCPIGWHESIYSGTCIKLFKDKTDWHNAKRLCREKQADLVKIDNYLMNGDIEGEKRTTP